MSPWVVIVAGVVAAEGYSKVTGRPTPSAEAARHPVVAFVVGSYLTGHLTRWLPYRWDVLRRLG